MPKKKSNTSKEEEFEQSYDFQILKMLADPMRVRIVLELLIHKELSTKQLQARIPVSRSTLGHHLQKLEENNIISVRIQPKSYSVKFYSISKPFDSKFSLKKAIKTTNKNKQSEIIMETFSALTGVLQFLANIAYESLTTLMNGTIKDVHENDQKTYYTIDDKENMFIPAHFAIIPNYQVNEFVSSLREFIKKTSVNSVSDKTLTNEDLPLYAFISTGFPILFKKSIEPAE